MSDSGNHNSGTVAPKAFGVLAAESGRNAGHTLATTSRIRHVYVHIPFCARICPYCAFYKELLDRSRTERFCQALLDELVTHARKRSASAGPTADDRLRPVTIYFGGGTPTALTTEQLEFLL